MFNTLFGILGTILGFKTGSSISNTVSGIANYAVLLPAATWMWFNKADEIIFQILFNYKGKMETFTILQTTVGGMSLIVAGIFIYLEFLRRSNPGLRINS